MYVSNVSATSVVKQGDDDNIMGVGEGLGELIRRVGLYRSMLVMMGAIRKAVLAAAVASEKIRQGR